MVQYKTHTNTNQRLFGEVHTPRLVWHQLRSLNEMKWYSSVCAFRNQKYALDMVFKLIKVKQICKIWFQRTRFVLIKIMSSNEIIGKNLHHINSALFSFTAEVTLGKLATQTRYTHTSLHFWRIVLQSLFLLKKCYIQIVFDKNKTHF